MERQQENLPVRPARLGPALKRGLGDIWDRLGLVIGASFIWFLSIFAPVSLGIELARRGGALFLPLGVLLTFLIGVTVTAGVFVMAHRVVTREDPALSDLKAGFTEYFAPAIKLALVDLAVTAVLVVDVAFFFGVIGPGEAPRSPVLLVFGVLFAYLLFIWLMTLLYHLPILIWQRPATLTILKRALLLTADNPFFTFGLLFAMIPLTILCAVTVVGMAVLFVGAVAILLTHALRELFIKYGVVEEPPQFDDAGWPRQS